jgi:hypothetical protein
MDEINDQQLTCQYDAYAQHYNKLTYDIKMVITSDDKIRRKQLQKKAQQIHTIMQHILKLRVHINDDKNSEA